MCVFSCKKEKAKDVVAVDNTSALIEAFRFSPDSKPIISVHRGGKGIAHYPENCLETLKYINDSIQATFEIDVAKTKDNVLVLMHDNTLERTTTGTDKLTNYTYSELQAFYLEDDYGNETTFKIPTFKEVLLWAKTNNVVLSIDIKRSLAVKDVIDVIYETEAKDISIIITYDIEQSKAAHQLAPELLLSVSARNMKEFNWLLASGIPTKNMSAFTGTRLSPDSLYTAIHNKGIKTILGTLGNLDKQAEARGDHLYKEWISKGIDVIATDRPFAVAKVLGLEK
jgi:glycerophosphoryl diester phosphodiesterase